MITRRTFAMSLAACTCFAAETSHQRAKRIVDKTIYALGGDALRYMSTRTEIGRAYSFYHEQLSGLSIARIYTKYLSSAGPGQVAEVQRQVFGKKQEDAVIFTTTGAYDVTYRGAKPMAEDRVKQFRETVMHDFFYILRGRMNEPGLEFDSGAPDVLENQPVETLQIYDSQDRNVTVWIDSETWLPVKQRFYRVDPVTNDRVEEVTRYARYRDAGDGVMWPFETEREHDTEKIFQLYSEQVKINEPLSDSLFQLPNGIRILKP